MQEPLRIYRGSKRVQRKNLLIEFVVFLIFFIYGIWLLLVSAQATFETCFALILIAASMRFAFHLTRIVCRGQSYELRVYADRLVVNNPWMMIRVATYDFADIKSVNDNKYDSDGWLELKLFSSVWKRKLSEDLFRDEAEAQEFCRYLTELLKTATPTINTPVA
jgi:hypothetical protein